MTDWEGIVRGHGPTVWRTLFRLLGRRADVDECFQETFLSALEMSRRQKVVCWSALLQTVATRKAVDRLRRKYRDREEATAMEAMASGMNDPSRAAEEAERAGLLEQAMTRLPARQAEAICLHAFSGWSYQEIGRATWDVQHRGGDGDPSREAAAARTAGSVAGREVRRRIMNENFSDSGDEILEASFAAMRGRAIPDGPPETRIAGTIAAMSWAEQKPNGLFGG